MVTRRNRRRAPPRPARSRIDLRRPLLAAACLAIVIAGLFVTVELLDRPVVAVDVQASFHRVSLAQVERVVRSELRGGFLSADLVRLRAELEALPWVDRVRIQRNWPARLDIAISEQVAAAVWGKDGLLNTRGELFVAHARHVPPELPRLTGPPGSEEEVAQLYLRLRRELAAVGVQLRGLELDARGAWQFELASGAKIRLGRGALEARLQRFVRVALPLLINRWREVEYVDMRYSNGFAVGWDEAARVASSQPQVPNV